MSELRLRYLSGSLTGQEKVFSGPRVRIGRSHDNEFVLPEADPPLSSGHHAEACLESGRWWIVDLRSTNRTLVNGAAVDRCQIRDGDRLTFGADEVRVQIGRTHRPRTAIGGAVALAIVVIVLAVVYALRGRTSRSPELIAARAARSVYLIAVEDTRGRAAIGTAFVVRNDGLLATNAHVVDELRRRGALGAASGPVVSPRAAVPPSGPAAVAVGGDSSSDVRPIVEGRWHPGWRPGSIRDDVAVVRVAPDPPLASLSLADERAVARLQRGTALIAFGFPTVLTDPRRPRGRLSADVLGDIRDGRYLTIGLGISPGTSGSPIFTLDGMVVAIVAGGDFIEGPAGRRVPSGTGANWAIAVSALRELLNLPQ